MDLNQVTIEVTDFDAALAFYRRLGLRLIVSARGEYARFEMPSGSSTLSLHRVDHSPAGNTVLYFEVDDVDRKHADLSAAGITFDTPPTDKNWRWREARLCDPAGNHLCIYHAGPDRRFPPWRLEDQDAGADDG